MKTALFALLGAGLLASCASAPSQYGQYNTQSSGFGLGGHVGTTGVSAEVKYSPSPRFQLRGNYNFLEFDVDTDVDDIEYEGDLKLNTFGGFADVAPFQNGFVLTGGAFIGDKTLDLQATPTTDVEIGGQLFTPEQVGTLDGQAELNNFAPYAGIGFDGFLDPQRSWSMNIRAGVMFTGSPEAELISADGTLSSDPLLRAELDAEVQQIEDDLDEYKYYPVISLGVSRRF